MKFKTGSKQNFSEPPYKKKLSAIYAASVVYTFVPNDLARKACHRRKPKRNMTTTEDFAEIADV